MQTLRFYRFRSVATSRHKLITMVDQLYLQHLVTEASGSIHTEEVRSSQDKLGDLLFQ